MRHHLLAAWLVLTAVCIQAPAQTPDSLLLRDGTAASVTLTTNVDSAFVLVDSLAPRRTPCTFSALTAGTHTLRLVHPDYANWMYGILRDTLHLVPGEVTTLRYTFTPRFLITSTPSGASVYAGDSLLGNTPLLTENDLPAVLPTLLLRKEGYESISGDSLHLYGGYVSAMFGHRTPGFAFPLGEEVVRPSRVPLYAAGGTTIVAGILAAAFKIGGDNRYASYGETGDPALLAQSRRFDTAGGIALVVTQIGLVLFTYLILSE